MQRKQEIQANTQELTNGDVKERDNIYVVEVEVGDYTKEELTISFHDGYLVVSGEKPATGPENMQKAFYIGKSVAQGNIRAALHNGVLKCMIPKDNKKESDGPTDVEIM